MAGRLELNPKIASVTKLAGDDKSFFVSCIPYSEIGAVGDSRIRAKNLEWKKKQKPPIGNNWVVMGSEQYSRLVVPYYLQKKPHISMLLLLDKNF